MKQPQGSQRDRSSAKSAVAPRRRRRRPSLTDAQFLSKAYAIFTENGFDGTTIDALAVEAGIAKRTIYQRFGDKKGVFIASINQAIDDWMVPTERLGAAETGDLEGTLQAIGQILVDNALSPSGLRLLRLTNAESGRMPEIGEHTVHFGSDRTIAYLAGLFQRYLSADATGGAGINLRDAEDAAESFLHLIVGGPANAAAWGVRRSRAAIDRRIRYSVGLFMHGLSGPGDVLSDRSAQALENETLKRLLAEAMVEIDRLNEPPANRQGGG